jgi:hypothetical protein
VITFGSGVKFGRTPKRTAHQKGKACAATLTRKRRVLIGRSCKCQRGAVFSGREPYPVTIPDD